MFRIDKDFFVFQSSMWQTNSVVYRNEAVAVVIDPTYFPSEIRIIASQAMNSKAFNKYVIFTHADFDHIVGHQYFNGFKFLGHSAFRTVDREAQLIQLNELDETYYVSRDKKFVFPEIDNYLEDGMRIPLAKDELLVIHAPGHTAESIFLISRSKRILVAGDYLSDLEFPFVYHSFRSYIDTLEKTRKLVDELEIEMVIPGHGDFAAGRQEILFRIDSDKAYLEEILARVMDYCARGMTLKEILEVLKEMSFRGEKITGVLVKMHMENIRKAVEEICAGN
ncbi:MBL fold metallo-hydrolase [Thermincola ferriacetica]